MDIGGSENNGIDYLFTEPGHFPWMDNAKHPGSVDRDLSDEIFKKNKQELRIVAQKTSETSKKKK